MMAAGNDIELMQHADGELDESADAPVKARLEKDKDARAKVESLAQISELVRGHLELSADAVSDRKLSAMWRQIDKGIEAENPTGVWATITAWFDRYRGHVVTGAVSAGAVAALALVLRSGDGDKVVGKPSGPIEVLPVGMRSAPVIESLDTPDGTGTVLNFADEDGHTTVIWVTPADTVEGI
jgi:hypothetical protein